MLDVLAQPGTRSEVLQGIRTTYGAKTADVLATLLKDSAIQATFNAQDSIAAGSAALPKAERVCRK